MKPSKPLARALKIMTLLALSGSLVTGLGFNQTSAATPALGPVWAPPQILLPYVADMPGLCVNTLDSTISYLAASGGNGEASGSEGNNWLNGTYTKLNDGYGTGGCAFDEFGTLHAVWSYRGDSGTYNFYYNSVQKGSGNVPPVRNLTREIYGKDKYTLAAHIAVSLQQKKVFIIYQERGEDGDPLMFIESGTQGDTWSKPVQLGVLSGYRPAESDIIVDKAGLPHVFYGVFKEGGPSIINHRMRLADGRWTQDENITGDDLSRPIWTQAELDPTSGDIYVSWLEGQTGISSWDAATGKWSHTANISNSGGRAFWPTIAVNTQTGVVWDIWVDADNIWSRQSADHGKTWQGKELVVNLGAAKIGRIYGLKARSTRGIIYLLISADQLDPLYYVGPTLELMTFNQSVFSQPVTPTAAPTAPPPPTGTVAPGPTPAPTNTPVPTATPLPLTATQVPPTSTPKPPATATATATNVPVPAQGNSQPQDQNQNQGQPQPQPQAQTNQPPAAAQPPQPTNPPPTTAPVAPTTRSAEEVQATAVAQAQKIAAATPQTLVIPAPPTGTGGRGPALVLSTATPLPTATSTPEPTVAATATLEAGPSPIGTMANSVQASQPVTITQEATSAKPGPAPTVPPSPGALWLLPLSLVVTAKGLLNLFGILLKP